MSRTALLLAIGCPAFGQLVTTLSPETIAGVRGLPGCSRPSTVEASRDSGSISIPISRNRREAARFSRIR